MEHDLPTAARRRNWWRWCTASSIPASGGASARRPKCS